MQELEDIMARLAYLRDKDPIECPEDDCICNYYDTVITHIEILIEERNRRLSLD